jgi:uncharacterized protein (TIGR03790 family)
MSNFARFGLATTVLGALTCLACGDASSTGPIGSAGQGVTAATFSGPIHPQAASNLCLDVAGQGTANGTAVQLWSCTGNPNQQWTYNGTTLSVYGNKCLDVTGGSTANGTKLQIWDCAAKNANQTWTASGATFQWKGKGKCLDLANAAANGTRAESSACVAGAASQAWSEKVQAAAPQEVLIVINDASTTSVAVGTAYAQGRGLSGILHINCQDSAASEDNETIDFADYQAQIETPIRAYLQSNPNVAFIVTTRGIPIRIYGGQTGNAADSPDFPLASLDDYLAALDYDTLPGVVSITFNAPNAGGVGKGWLNRYYNATVPFSHAQFGGYLVTRLDGYTKANAESLATRALQAEQGLQPGVVLLDIDPSRGMGDGTPEPAPIKGTTITTEGDYGDWNADLQHANDELVAENIPTYLNTQPLMVGDMTNLLGYFSWGSNDSYFDGESSNPTKSPHYNSLGFLPGAIGDTAVSTGGRSFFKQTSGQSMIADLITQGITGIKGYTDEPLLESVSSPTIVMDRYTHGFTFAESIYAGSHFVGWVDIVIGDPLTRPYLRSAVAVSTP